jgi:hypothetical protein
VPSLNALATELYDDQNTYADLVHVVHILVIEPHPQDPDPSPYGGRVWEARYSTVPQPASFEERQAVALQLEETIEGNQLLLIDDMVPQALNNPIWCTYGPAPNSAYLIRQDGILDTVQTWLDVDGMRDAIDRVLQYAR